MKKEAKRMRRFRKLTRARLIAKLLYYRKELKKSGKSAWYWFYIADETFQYLIDELSKLGRHCVIVTEEDSSDNIIRNIEYLVEAKKEKAESDLARYICEEFDRIKGKNFPKDRCVGLVGKAKFLIATKN